MELNRPAVITLEQCKPPSNPAMRNMSSPEKAKMREKYVRKVRKMTEEKGAEFVSYDQDEGTWVFKVMHF